MNCDRSLNLCVFFYYYFVWIDNSKWQVIFYYRLLTIWKLFAILRSCFLHRKSGKKNIFRSEAFVWHFVWLHCSLVDKYFELLHQWSFPIAKPEILQNNEIYSTRGRMSLVVTSLYAIQRLIIFIGNIFVRNNLTDLNSNWQKIQTNVREKNFRPCNCSVYDNILCDEMFIRLRNLSFFFFFFLRKEALEAKGILQ